MTKISRTELTISRSPRALAIAQKEEPWDAPDAQVSLPLRNDSGSRRAAAARRPPGFCSRSVAAASARLDPATETAASRLTQSCSRGCSSQAKAAARRVTGATVVLLSSRMEKQQSLLV